MENKLIKLLAGKYQEGKTEKEVLLSTFTKSFQSDLELKYKELGYDYTRPVTEEYAQTENFSKMVELTKASFRENMLKYNVYKAELGWFVPTQSGYASAVTDVLSNIDDDEAKKCFDDDVYGLYKLFSILKAEVLKSRMSDEVEKENSVSDKEAHREAHKKACKDFHDALENLRVD